MRFVRPNSRRRYCGLLLALVACWHASSAPLVGGDPQPVDEAVAAEIGRLVVELDHPQFAARHKAAARLEVLAERPELKTFLAGRFRHALLAPETSFEVRSHLEPLLRSLPGAVAADDEPPLGESAIVPLADQLNSDSYAERDSAVRRLRAMLAHEELIGPLSTELKRRAADPARSASEHRTLEPLCDQAREAWLLADPDKVRLPEPPAEQIARWIDDVSRLDENVPAEAERRSAAERELMDLIAGDDMRPRVLEMLRAKIAASAASGRNLLEDLIEFAQPAMAAEVWANHTHIYQQYLIIGMSQYNEAADPPKATLFDRIDELTAHCVSGNALSSGDYPVRVAIPHPQPGQETMYYLTNLPTPRRRLAYEYHLRRNEAARLEELTARTLDYFLRRQTPLAENEILMLPQLEPRAVSRFAGDYFESVPNDPLISVTNGLNNQSNVHGGVCAVLSRIGTHEAVPALERLARSGKLRKPTHEDRVEVAWVAALAIAQRDPWPELDEWLAALIDEKLPLTTDPDRPPELGASAAGMLLDRHGASTRPFGLETSGESVTDSFRFIGYRFSSDRDRQDVKRWWQKQKTLAEAGRAANLTGEPTIARSIHPGRAVRQPAERRQAADR